MLTRPRGPQQSFIYRDKIFGFRTKTCEQNRNPVSILRRSLVHWWCVVTRQLSLLRMQ